MNVLYTGTSYPRSQQDWRGRFIYQIAKALSQSNSLDIRTWLPPGIKIENTTDVSSARDAAWLEQLLERGGIAHLLRNKPIAGVLSGLTLLKSLKRVYRENNDVDIYHINWLQNALALGSDSTPAVISVLGTDFKMLSLPGMRFAVRNAIKSRKTVFTPNAEWMVDKLYAMFGDIAQIKPVPFGVDSDWYTLQRNPPTAAPRKWLVVLRVTQAKMGKLFDWGKPLFSGASDELHLFGPMQENVAIPDWVHYHGSTNPQELLDTWFPQACAMISLSVHDEGRPQVLLEAMAAGLPIIASTIDAHQDLLQQNVDGLLIDSSTQFKESVGFLSNEKNNLQMGVMGRANMLKKIGTWEHCADKYIDIYRSLL